MAAPAERMKAMRERRRVRGLRELRLVCPDARSRSVRRRVADQVARLDKDNEERIMNFIEAVSVFNEDSEEW
jgi:Antitoxin MazE-like